MADAMLSAAAGRLIALIEETARYHVNLVMGAEDEVQSLAEELDTIRYVVDDAEKRRFKDNNINYWLWKLEGMSYDMEDVLDEWDHAIRKLEKDQPNAAASKEKVRSFVPSCACLCFKKVVVRHEIATKILSVKTQLDGILKEKDRYSFVISQPTDHPSPRSWRDPSTSFTVVEEVHGRDYDRDTLVGKLLMGNGGSFLRVVSIVGVGGLGKTTLAQLVYNHSEVKKKFDLRIWICVSDPFNLVSIAKGIIESVRSGDCPITDNLGTLWQCVRDSISGKKILLVLDDVWTEEYGKWEPLEKNLRCGGAGSKILVTTRKTKVAKIMGTIDEDILCPNVLTDKDCWLLMRRIACLGRDEVGFEDIGKEIAKKCNGLPLAARTLGSLLRSKSTLGQWEVVLSSDIWEMKEVEVELFPHLILSYNELSPTLRRCFSYCAIFPKDTIIDVKELIENWMALGYLGSDSIGVDMEDRGREYFDILAMHSLFQDFWEYDSDGRIVSCRMHDIVHDFARFIRKSGRVDATRTNKCTTCRVRDPSQIYPVNEFKSLFWDNKESPPSICDCLTRLRVLSLRNCNLQRIPQIVENFFHLRWLNLNGNELSQESLTIIFQLFNLKTLYLCDCSLKEIPTQIENLIHLRRLDLSKNTDLKELPTEIGNLIHLKHLDLSWNKSLKELPREIGNLIHLRHFYLRGISSLHKLQIEIGNLNSLKHFDLSQNPYLKELPREIGNLNSLKHFDLSQNPYLKELPREIGNLNSLKHFDLSENYYLKELPREIGNLINLELLDLSYAGYLDELPGEIGNLIRLRHLNLCNSTGLKELPREIGNLMRLEHLNLSRNGSMKVLPVEIWNLSNLKHLDLSNNSLEKLPEEIGNLIHLRHLDLCENGSLKVLPEKIGNLSHLKHLNLSGNMSLEKLPESIGSLSELQSLDVTFCQRLRELPEGLAQVASLPSLVDFKGPST